MGTFKHTLVACLAVAMIGSLAAIQTASLSIAKAEKLSVISSTPTDVWDDILIDKNMKLSAITQSSDISVASVDSNLSDTYAYNDENIDTSVGYVLLSEGTLNVRESASTDAEIIGQLNCGEKVSIIENLADWYKVSYGAENNVGFVASASITHSEQEAKDATLKSFLYETGKTVVTDGALNIRSGAGTDFAVVDQLDNDDTVIIVEKENDWLKIYYGKNYDIGYVIADSVQVSGTISKSDVATKKSESIAKSAVSKGNIAISSGALNIRSSANESASVVAQLSNRTQVLILDKADGWIKIAYGANNAVGYVKSEYIIDASLVSRSSTTRPTETQKPTATQKPETTATKKETATKSATSKTTTSKSTTTTKTTTNDTSSSNKGQALVNQAAKYIGTRYVYGGASPSGFDCSGLVQYSARQLGISVGRSSRDQFNNGVAVSKENLQPGDLVFFAKNGTISHVGIYAGNGQMIHSPQTGKTVTYTSINSASRVKSYAGARRIVN